MIGKYDYITLEELTTPKNGHQVIMDRYWLTLDGKILRYEHRKQYYPQCNNNKGIVERWANNGRDGYCNGYIFVPVAYWPIYYD